MEYKALAQEAVNSKLRAYPKYSNFHVGAALLCESGKVYTGINIEISSYSLTMCAERTAIFKAFSEGDRHFKAIAIASDSADYCPPCGSCLQVISDLCGNIDIVLINHKEEILIKQTYELLPLAFSSEDLNS